MLRHASVDICSQFLIQESLRCSGGAERTWVQKSGDWSVSLALSPPRGRVNQNWVESNKQTSLSAGPVKPGSNLERD